MSSPEPKSAPQNHGVLLALILVLCSSLYLLIYSGYTETTDTRFMFDAVESFVRHGDFLQDTTAGERMSWNYDGLSSAYPLLPVDAEPLQILLASPLYWIAQHLPLIGMVHTVWLFNIMVMLVIIPIFYGYILELGYSTTVAVVVTLVYATATSIVPYTKTFFQEPLTVAFVLSIAYTIHRWQASCYRLWHWLGIGLVLIVLGVFARRSVLVAVPAWLLIASPYGDSLFRPYWRQVLLWCAILVLVVGLYYYTLPQSAQVIDLRRGHTGEWVWYDMMLRASNNQAIQGYLFSIGGSFWGTSPIILLGLLGMGWLGYQRTPRYTLVTLTMTLTYVFFYAKITSFEWFGGLSFPPRFLLALIPFWMLCSLPVWAWLLQPRLTLLRMLTWLVTGSLLLYSLWIQFNGVSYWWGVYSQLLPAEAQGFTEWYGGLNQWEYLRWNLLPTQWGIRPFDFAWVRNDNSVWGIVFGGLALSSLCCLCWIHSLRVQYQRLLVAFHVVGLLGGICWGILSIRHDPAYLGFSVGLHRLVDAVNQHLQDGDTLLIANPGYEKFIMNYGKFKPDVRVIGLPLHPGEQPSPDQYPLVQGENPMTLIQRPTVQLIDTIAQRAGKLWVVYDNSQFIPWSIRPVERYMTQYYFPVQEHLLSGEDGLVVRLVEYHTAVSHSPFEMQPAQTSLSLCFAEQLCLKGLTLSDGYHFQGGETVPIATEWYGLEALPTDYVIAFFLADVDNQVVAQAQDSQPVAGFYPTSQWQPFAPVWDHRAIRLPTTLPKGEYHLLVAVYHFDSNGQLVRLPVDTSPSLESGTIASLPIKILVEK
ncbi:MAG: hypothetical protein ACOYLB_03020 [Phototrophicaceae bacterium]